MRNSSVRARSRRRLISSSSVVRQLCGDGTAISGDACFGMGGMIQIGRAESKRSCPKLFTGCSHWTQDRRNTDYPKWQDPFMLPVMRRLKIKLSDLEGAFETNFPEMHDYLDTETGEVLNVTDDIRQELEQLWEEAGPKDKLEDLLRKSKLPDLQKKALAEAQRVEDDYGTRIVRAPEPDSHRDGGDVDAFIATIAEPALREELHRAFRGRGAFRRFREVLGDNFRERERWFQFKRERLRQHMTDWLASLDIEPLWEEPPPLPPQPPVRTQLLEAALAFVRSAARLPGVKRIALIGSLTTPESSPKDADLLVSVTDDMNLAPLAKAARQLNGRALQTSRSRGADVFLADVGGHYLGQRRKVH